MVASKVRALLAVAALLIGGFGFFSGDGVFLGVAFGLILSNLTVQVMEREPRTGRR